jgi:23S rRNA (pseudouridine1915-N3)-methyltransferase
LAIRILCLGKTDQSYVLDGLDVFKKRLNKYIKLTWEEIPDQKKHKKLSPNERKQAEGEIILAKIAKEEFVIGLDEGGKQYGSVEFSNQLNHWMVQQSKITLLIGGAYGFSDDLYKRMNSKLSLSKMTYSHQMVRLLLVEQMYRVFTILNGDPYHNE